MYEVNVNPEIPGLEPSNPGISGLRKKFGIQRFGIPGLQSLYGRQIYATIDLNVKSQNLTAAG
jgi:hypothetical protein